MTRLFVQPPVGRELRLTRDELQQTIHPLVARTVGELDRTIRGAGCGPNDLAGIFCAGGSSRIPWSARCIHQHFGRAPVVLDSPKAVIVRGAAVSDGLGRRLDEDEVVRGLAMLGLVPDVAPLPLRVPRAVAPGPGPGPGPWPGPVGPGPGVPGPGAHPMPGPPPQEQAAPRCHDPRGTLAPEGGHCRRGGRCPRDRGRSNGSGVAVVVVHASSQAAARSCGSGKPGPVRRGPPRRSGPRL